jgi:cytochrome P450
MSAPSLDAVVNPIGEYGYARDSLEWREIHRSLEATPHVDAFERGMASKDADTRRVAQIDVLRAVKLDPLGLFRELRSVRPILSLPDLSLHLVVRDADVRSALSQPTLFSVRDYADRMEPVVGDYMLDRDGDPEFNLEEKRWMRTLFQSADFARIRALVREAAADWIEERPGGDGTLEVVSALGRPVPLHVVQKYIGFDAPTDKMLEWSFRTQDSFFHNVGFLRGARGWLVRTLGVGGAAVQASQRTALEVHERAFAAGREMQKFLDEFITSARTAILAHDTVLSRMLQTNDRLAHPKRHERLRSNVIGGLVGAVETSNAAIVQSLDQLLKRPAVWAEARAAAAELKDADAIHTSRFAKYVWEALRYFPINPFVVRYAERDAWLGAGDFARHVRAGDRILAATHSAMHDPRTAESPTEFRPDRPERDREMNLGYGHHRCLGDAVSQVVVPEVLRQLVLLDLERVPESPPLPDNQGIDFGTRGSFPECYTVRRVRR